jgi:DNA-binding response OmpR family regulator
LGADDYVVKPFSVRELMARVKNVLRRTTTPAAGPAAPVIRAGDLIVDPARHEAWWRDVALDLTALEFDLLQRLALHAGQVLSREQLLEQVWGYDYYGDLRVVDAAIKRLRAKLRRASTGADPIATVRGVGYKLAQQSANEDR